METPKNYKWSWSIDQRAIVESGLPVDVIDYSILRMLVDFATSEFCKKMQEGNETYYYFHWTLVRDQMPTLKLNTRQSVNKRIRKLATATALYPHKDNKAKRNSWFKFGEGRATLIDNKRKRKLPKGNESYDNDEKEHQTGKRKLPKGNNGLLDRETKVTKQGNESLHNTTNNNKEDNNTGTSIDDKPSEGKFTPPTVEQLEAYCKHRNVKKEYAQVFWDFNFNRDWKLKSGKKMKCWKAAFRTSMQMDWNTKYKNIDTSQDATIDSGVQDNHKLSDKYEPIYLDRVKAIYQKTNGRISYFTRAEFSSWLKGGKNFEKWRDRGLLEKDIPKKIKNTISYLATNTFAQQLRGNLQDFVEEAFKGKIKQIS
ncbi:MAG: hypothetical protein ACW98F_18740 [Candidatus Hodarchaeales archaeon]|jgi:hypothetical protein